MATDVATLSIKVVHDDVDKAARSLDKLAASGAKAETATKPVGRNISREMALAEMEARKMDDALVKTAESARMAKVAIAAAAVAAVGLAIGHKIVTESIESQDALAQLNAVLKSTAGVAGVTSGELQDLATHIQDVSTYSDEAVQHGEAMLLTFKNIRGDRFKEATQAVVDMAAAFRSSDLEGTAIQVGKALNDPIKGVTALQKVGVSLSQSQKELVKNLVDTGRGAEAQAIILKELQSEFGGSAEAARNTLGGALAHLSNVWGDLFEVSTKSSGGVILAINAIADVIPKARDAIGEFITNTIVGSNNIAATWQKMLAVFAITPNAIAHGLGGAKKIFTDTIQQIEEERRAANALARTPGADDSTGGRKAAPASFDTSDEAKKAQEITRAREEELKKLVAVNAAYGKSTLEQQILGIQYDANIQKAKDRAELHGRELGRVNALTDAIARQKIITLELADAEERAGRLRATQRDNFERTRAARQNFETAQIDAAASRRIPAPFAGIGFDTTDAGARAQIDQKAENDLLAARLDFAEKTRKATADQAETARKEYESTVARVAVEHDLAVATQDVREENERILAVQRATSGIIEDALDALEHHENPLKKWAEDARRATNRWLGDIVGQKVGSIFGGLNRGQDAAAAKQLTASAGMNAAGDKMITAAQIMSGVRPAGAPTGTGAGPTSGGRVAQREPDINPALQKAIGYAAIALGAAQQGVAVGGGLASTSHGAAGNYARGAAGGAAVGALTGAAIGSVIPGIGTAVGAVVGGLVGMVGGLVGAKEAMKDFSAAAVLARDAVANTLGSLKARNNKDSLAAAIDQVKQEQTQIAKSIEDAYSGGGANSDTVRERTRLLAELKKEEEAYIEQLKEEARVKSDRTIEDYEARAAAATPGNEAAEAEAAFLRNQRREREDLVASFGPEIDARERATLAALDNAQSAELAAARAKGFASAVGAAEMSIRNAPEGFWMNPYLRDYAERAPAIAPAASQPRAPLAAPDRPNFTVASSAPASSRAPMTIDLSGMVIQVPKDATSPIEYAKAVVAGVRDYIDTIGINLSIAEGLEQMGNT